MWVSITNGWPRPHFQTSQCWDPHAQSGLQRFMSRDCVFHSSYNSPAPTLCSWDFNARQQGKAFFTSSYLLSSLGEVYFWKRPNNLQVLLYPLSHLIFSTTHKSAVEVYLPPVYRWENTLEEIEEPAQGRMADTAEGSAQDSNSGALITKPSLFHIPFLPPFFLEKIIRPKLQWVFPNGSINSHQKGHLWSQ